MKKTLTLFLLGFALFALIACDAATTITTSTATTQVTTASSETTTTTASSSETTTTTASSSETTTTTTTQTTSTTTSTALTTTTTLDPNSLLANIPAECEGVDIVAGWIPTWCEEFNYQGAVNQQKWRHQVAGGGFGNQELQYYTSRSQNAIVDGEKLIITAIKENYSGHAYTSAKIWTQGVKNWKYGKFEIRAKMPSTGGTWPAFWMMPKSINYPGYSTSPINNGWPNSGEIDIMEYVGNNPTNLLGTIHTGKYNHTTGTQIGFNRIVAGLSSSFNTFSITWNETSISWYVNDLKYGTTTFNPASNTDVETYMAWPFDQEFYMILNLAIGGGLGGAVDPAFVSDTFEIDYVRVFQKDFVTGDTANPFPISNLEAVRKTATSAYLIWSRAIDNMQVKWYNVYIDGVLNHKVSVNTIKLSGLPQNVDILVEIEAEDYAGNRSAKTPITFRTAS